MSTYKNIKEKLIVSKIDDKTHNTLIEGFYNKNPFFKLVIDSLIHKFPCLMNRVQATRWLLGYIKLSKCTVCGKRLDTKASLRGASFCSMACRKTPEGKIIWNKAKEDALMKKYGVINVGQLKSVKEKTKSTNIKRYGVDNSAKRKDIQEKIAQTNLEKYGVRNPFQLESVKKKVIEINKSEERNNKLRKSWNKRATNYRLDELKKYNLEFLSGFNYERIRVNGSGWLETDLHCTKCNKIFHYKFNSSKNLARACPYCHPFSQSAGEEEIGNFVRSLGFNVETCNRSIIRPQELDIYISEKKLAIEFNGLYWHCERQGKDRNYHLDKTKVANEQGVRLIHIFEDEWLNKQQIVKARLKNILGVTPYKIQARKCEVKTVANSLASKFLNKYHIQGAINASVNLGLFYKNRLVALMTFGKSRFNKNHDYELLRYCTVTNFNIVGGAGKLFNYFKKNYEFKSIISYADRRWSNGGLYRALEFVELSPSSPSYYYVKEDVRFNRVKFQKHKLANILENFDPELSEVENMYANGYERIWDCGNLCFAYFRTEL